jgi:hypothetical protein
MKESTRLNDVPKNAPKEVEKAYEQLERYKWTRAQSLAYERARLAEMDEYNSNKTAERKGILIGEKIGEKKGREEGRHELLLELIRYKFGDISAKDSSMIKQLNAEQILEAKTLKELIQTGGCGNNMSKTSPTRISPRKRLRTEITV